MKIGDKVIHQQEGACYVSNIVEKEIYDFSKKYYVLTPLLNEKMKIFVSKDNTNANRVRPIISQEDWEDAESKVDSRLYDWVEDAQKRYRSYTEIIGTFVFDEVLFLYKTLVTRNQECTLKLRDRGLMQAAEKLICSELALLLNQDYDAIVNLKSKQYIATQ